MDPTGLDGTSPAGDLVRAEVSIEAHQVLTRLGYRRRQPGASGRSLPANCLSRHSCRSLCHSGPKAASCTPGEASRGSTNATASAIGVVCWPAPSASGSERPSIKRVRLVCCWAG